MVVRMGQPGATPRHAAATTGARRWRVPSALAFDSGYGNVGGLWISHSRGLQASTWVWGAQRFGPPGQMDNMAAHSGCRSPTSPLSRWWPLARRTPRQCGLVDRRRQHRTPDPRRAPAVRRSSTWRYYAGRRWLTDTRVRAPSGGGALLAAATRVSPCPGGGVDPAEEGGVLQTMVSPRHDRYGYVDGCGLQCAGSPRAMCCTTRTATGCGRGCTRRARPSASQ